MNRTIEELGEELCNYCFCTEYGLDLNAPKMKAPYLLGCEGIYCRRAYENYLEERAKEEEEE